MAFAAGWTPCIGPILGGIIGLAGTVVVGVVACCSRRFTSAGLAVPVSPDWFRD
jgi:cytochrome c-type biogenesis protein